MSVLFRSSNSCKLFRLALIRTGIGAIVVALGSLVAYLSSSEQAANRFRKILKTVGGIVRELIRYLDPLGEFIFDRLEEGFNLAGAAALTLFSLISKGLAALGFEKAAAGVDRFANRMINASRDARRSEEQRVEQECVSPFRDRWSPDLSK